MKRVKLVVAYDGTHYCGWQYQSNGITIEEVLNQALTALLGEPVAVIGASRTDSGVHAEGNVAVFDTESPMRADKICFAVNQRLPEDIRVLESEEVPAGWHPRKQNCVKTYEYQILNRKIAMPTRRLYAYFCYFPLDVDKMRQGAAYLLGEHDFKSFCTARGQAEETVRTIYSLDVDRDGDLIRIRVCGSGFLYNMVRIIAGTLMKVGMGVYPPEHVEEILEARDRKQAGPTAPARGLTLKHMEYETELRDSIRGENRHWAYELFQTEVREKGKAYLVIERCEDDAFDGLVSRVTHQAVRNGARQVFVCDREGRLRTDRNYGYYRFGYSHDMAVMEKAVCQAADPVSPDVSLAAVGPGEEEAFCRLYNQVFWAVPNSAVLTAGGMNERLASGKEGFYYVRFGEDIAGFLILKAGQDCMEVDSLGIREELRRRGAARAALTLAEAMAREQGLGRMRLTAADSNVPAVRLYESMGYRRIPQERRTSSWYETDCAGYPG